MAGYISKDGLAFSRVCEQICFNYLGFLTGVTGWFHTMEQNPELNEIDFHFFDTKNRTGEIELKNRSIPVDRYQTLYIEPNKLAALKNSKSKKKWYLNFCENSKEKFWICDVEKLPTNLVSKLEEVRQLYETGTKKEIKIHIPIQYGKYYEYYQPFNKYIELDYDSETKKFKRLW